MNFLPSLLFSRPLLALLCSFACVQVIPSALFAEEQAEVSKPVKFGPWEYLYRGSTQSLKKSSLEFLEDFSITGAHSNDIFRLNEVVCDGSWRVQQGALQQVSGRSAAMKLGTAENFELEAGINGEGDGGWFILFGFNEGAGYGIYNVTLRTSGSPWFLSEFARGRGIEEADQEFARYECRGNEALSLRVVDGKVSLKVNRRVLLEEEELPSYQAGDIIVGTYDTKYGPKPLKIYGLRLRKPQEPE